MSATLAPAPVAAAADATRRPSDARRRRGRRTALWAALFLAPSAIPLAAFTLWPMLHAAWISLHDWNLIAPMRWVGLDNYATVLTDVATWNALLHTVAYIAGYLPLVYVGGLAVALALDTRLRGRTLLRGIYFLPVVTSWIAVALVWRWLLNPSTGIVNVALGWLGIDGPGWWTDPVWAMPSVILASAWKDLGFVMVILLAGLQAIPQEVREAARVDGAGRWRTLWSITLPLLSPSTFFVVVISLINGFQVFDQVYAMVGPSAAAASEVVVQRIYDLTFSYGRAGEASALSWILFVVILAVTLVQIRGQRRWVHDA